MDIIGALVLALAVWTFLGSSREGPRLRRLTSTQGAGAERPSLVESPIRRAFLCAVAVATVGWVVGGALVAVAGIVAGALLSVWIGKLEPPSVTKAREQGERDLPLAVDLLASCLAVGRGPQDALPIVARSVGGALGSRLEEIASRLALGADPAVEWSRCAHDPLLGELGRTMRRSTESGAPLVEGLSRLAEDRRRDRRTATQVRARNVGVKAAGPLAACFLPAFMLVGVVPTVAGGFERLFS